MTYTAEQTREFFAKKIFNNLQRAYRENMVESAMNGIAQGIADFRVKHDKLTPEIAERMINVYDTEGRFLERQRSVVFKQHLSTGKGRILLDAALVVLREDSGVVLLDISEGRTYPIAETLEEAQFVVDVALARGTK